MAATLTAEIVEGLFAQCLAGKADDPGATIIEGIVRTAAFGEHSLAANRETIIDLLEELPDEYRASVGGGYTFLNACNNRLGEMWAGAQQTMEALFMLGMAVGVVEECLPREMWKALPGGVPYYAYIDTERRQAELEEPE